MGADCQATVLFLTAAMRRGAPFYLLHDRNDTMASFSLTLIGVESVKDVNKVTTALMMMDGVKEAEVGRGFAEVDGQVRYDALVKTVEKAGYKVK